MRSRRNSTSSSDSSENGEERTKEQREQIRRIKSEAKELKQKALLSEQLEKAKIEELENGGSNKENEDPAIPWNDVNNATTQLEIPLSVTNTVTETRGAGAIPKVNIDKLAEQMSKLQTKSPQQGLIRRNSNPDVRPTVAPIFKSNAFSGQEEWARIMEITRKHEEEKRKALLEEQRIASRTLAGWGEISNPFASVRPKMAQKPKVEGAHVRGVNDAFGNSNLFGNVNNTRMSLAPGGQVSSGYIPNFRLISGLSTASGVPKPNIPSGIFTNANLHVNQPSGRNNESAYIGSTNFFRNSDENGQNYTSREQFGPFFRNSDQQNDEWRSYRYNQQAEENESQDGYDSHIPEPRSREQEEREKKEFISLFNAGINELSNRLKRQLNINVDLNMDEIARAGLVDSDDEEDEDEDDRLDIRETRETTVHDVHKTALKDSIKYLKIQENMLEKEMNIIVPNWNIIPQAMIPEREKPKIDGLKKLKSLIKEKEKSLASMSLLTEKASGRFVIPADTKVNVLTEVESRSKKLKEYMLTGFDPSQEVNFEALFRNMFKYGEKRKCSHEDYKLILKKALVNEKYAYDLRQMLKYKMSLKRIVDTFADEHIEVETQESLEKELCEFARLSNEKIIVCMNRLENIIRKVNYGTAEKEMINLVRSHKQEKLNSNISANTRKELDVVRKQAVKAGRTINIDALIRQAATIEEADKPWKALQKKHAEISMMTAGHPDMRKRTSLEEKRRERESSANERRSRERENLLYEKRNYSKQYENKTDGEVAREKKWDRKKDRIDEARKFREKVRASTPSYDRNPSPQVKKYTSPPPPRQFRPNSPNLHMSRRQEFENQHHNIPRTIPAYDLPNQPGYYHAKQMYDKGNYNSYKQPYKGNYQQENKQWRKGKWNPKQWQNRGQQPGYYQNDQRSICKKCMNKGHTSVQCHIYQHPVTRFHCDACKNGFHPPAHCMSVIIPDKPKVMKHQTNKKKEEKSVNFSAISAQQQEELADDDWIYDVDD